LFGKRFDNFRLRTLRKWFETQPVVLIHHPFAALTRAHRGHREKPGSETQIKVVSQKVFQTTDSTDNRDFFFGFSSVISVVK
jgi:hypothetical protein